MLSVLKSDTLGAKSTNNSRCIRYAAGIFFWIVLSSESIPNAYSLAPPSPASIQNTILEQCISGFETHKTDGLLRDEYFEFKKNGSSDATIRPEIINWMNEHSWQQGYSLWIKQRKNKCTSNNDGYEFLSMHRYLLQSMRSLWPSMRNQFSGWNKFPTIDDYPVILADQFKAWPDEVLKSARLIDSIPKMSSEEILNRWSSEENFGHWIECGTETFGLGTNSLYGSLLYNGFSTIGDHNLSSPEHRLDAYLFWKITGWIDKAWDRYRKALGKTPYDIELQAELLNHCQLHLSLAEQTKKTHSGQKQLEIQPLFIDGELNTLYKDKAASLLGEIIEIKSTVSGETYYKINLRLKGVKPIWLMGSTPIASNQLEFGGRYVFTGHIKAMNAIDPSGSLKHLLKSSSLFIAESIQSPK